MTAVAWNSVFALAANIAIVVMEIIAARLSHRRNGRGMFRFYTELSNIFAGIAAAVFCVFQAPLAGTAQALPVWVRTLKYASVSCLAVTLVVVVCILSPMMGKGGLRTMMLEDSMLYHHFICPVLAIISFVLWERGPEIGLRAIWFALIFTVVYAAVTIVLNALRKLDGPYPFLKVHDQPVWMSVLWVSVILGGAALLAWGLLAANSCLAH